MDLFLNDVSPPNCQLKSRKESDPNNVQSLHSKRFEQRAKYKGWCLTFGSDKGFFWLCLFCSNLQCVFTFEWVNFYKKSLFSTKDFTANDQEVDDEPLEEDLAFCLPRDHVPHAYLDLSSTDMASMDEHLPETNIGYKLLIKMGWKAGQGLGSSQQGRREPIRIDTKSDSL
ncbi:1086_t:CDS:2, partial [Acaulospora morrowiae]